MSGLEVTRALRTRGLQTRVVLVTGQADATLRECALEAGASQILEKPFAPHELITALRAILSSRISRMMVDTARLP